MSGRRRYPEHVYQAMVVNWMNLQYHRFPGLEMAFAIPNENGRRVTPQQAGRSKAQGVKPGVPDLFIPVPMLQRPLAEDEAAGLFIEMKSKTGTVTAHQKRYLEYLDSVGYQTHVCHDPERATEIIREYMLQVAAHKQGKQK